LRRKHSSQKQSLKNGIGKKASNKAFWALKKFTIQHCKTCLQSGNILKCVRDKQTPANKHSSTPSQNNRQKFVDRAIFQFEKICFASDFYIRALKSDACCDTSIS